MRAAAACLALLAALASAAEPPPVERPRQDYTANAPGSYTLPVIQQGTDGWVLERSWWPRRLSGYTRGAVTLLSFVYTYCTDPAGCPLAYAAFAELQQRLAQRPEWAGRVRLVSLSFDPAHDTPEAMRVYGGARAGRGPAPWHFLTTWSLRFLQPILDGYGQDVEIERDAAGRPTRAITHMLKVFLLDADGRVREVYSAAFLHPQVMLNDIATLLAERAPPSRPPTAAPLAAPAAPPLGLPPQPWPAGVPRTPAVAELGRALFFDRRLSANGSMSCAMCHVPAQGFASNASQRAVGLQGRSLQRNAPSLLNVAWRPALFWDGRASALADQAWLPLLHADEMGNGSAAQVVARVRQLYPGRFEQAFGAMADAARIGQALAAFQAGLAAGDSDFDRWHYAGQPTLGAQAQAGFALFTGKARCAQCHSLGPRDALFSDGRFHATGAGARPAEQVEVELAPGWRTRLSAAGLVPAPPPDAGRQAHTGAAADHRAFRTPSLRDVARTAPYMHDGSLATLEDVVAFYDRGGPALGEPLRLTAAERAALVAFLQALDSRRLPAMDRAAAR